MKLPRLPNPGNLLEAKYTKEQMHAYALKAMAQEREECAKECQDRSQDAPDAHAVEAILCAATIRARGRA
jgi:hypothetical protein